METARAGSGAEVTPMVDNIMLLEVGLSETIERTIRIVKTRGSGHDGRRHLLRIAPDGIVVDRHV